MNISKLLTGTAVILVIFSLINLEISLASNRSLRLIIGLIFFFSSFWIIGYRKSAYLLFYTSLLICDFLLLHWEYSFSKHTYYLLHSLACIVLLIHIKKRLHFRELSKISTLEGISILTFFAINFGILVRLGEYFSTVIQNPLLKTLFYVNGLLIIILVIATFLYSTYFSSKISSLFFMSILGLTISELMVFSIYFIQVPEFRYVDSIFYILGHSALLKAIYEEKIRIENKRYSDSEVDETNSIEQEEKGVYR